MNIQKLTSSDWEGPIKGKQKVMEQKRSAAKARKAAAYQRAESARAAKNMLLTGLQLGAIVANQTQSQLALPAPAWPTAGSLSVKAVLHAYNLTRAASGNHFEQVLDGTDLAWCACASVAMDERIEIIQKATHYIRSHRPRPEQNVVITDFCGGRLLQIFLMVQGLLADRRRSIELNLIERNFKAESCGKWSFEAGKLISFEASRKKLLARSDVSVDSALQDFMSKVSEQTQAHAAHVNLRVYQTHQDYLEDVAAPKSHVLLMVDPGSVPVLVKKSQANMVGGWYDGQPAKNQEFVVYLPDQGRPFLYLKSRYRAQNPRKAAFADYRVDPEDKCDLRTVGRGLYSDEVMRVVEILRKNRGKDKLEIMNALQKQFKYLQFYSDPSTSFRSLAQSAEPNAFVWRVQDGLYPHSEEDFLDEPAQADQGGFGWYVTRMFRSFDALACRFV